MRFVCLLLLAAKVKMSMVQAGVPNLKGILLEIIRSDQLETGQSAVPDDPGGEVSAVADRGDFLSIPEPSKGHDH